MTRNLASADRALRWSLVVGALLSFVIAAATLIELGGSSADDLRDLLLTSLSYAWPTSIALLALVALDMLTAPAPSRFRLYVIGAWLLSSAGYLIATAVGGELPAWGEVASDLVIAGIPLMLYWGARVLLLRLGVPSVARHSLGLFVAGVGLLLTAPLALIVTCVITGSCP